MGPEPYIMRRSLRDAPDHVARLRAALARAKDGAGLMVTILPELPGRRGPVLTWTQDGQREQVERPDMAQLADWAEQRWPADLESAAEERLLADLRETYPDVDIAYHPCMGYVASPKGAQVTVAATLAGLARKLSRRLPGSS